MLHTSHPLQSLKSALRLHFKDQLRCCSVIKVLASPRPRRPVFKVLGQPMALDQACAEGTWSTHGLDHGLLPQQLSKWWSDVLKGVPEDVPRKRTLVRHPGIEIPNAQATAKLQKLGMQIPLHQDLGLGLSSDCLP